MCLDFNPKVTNLIMDTPNPTPQIEAKKSIQTV